MAAKPAQVRQEQPAAVSRVHELAKRLEDAAAVRAGIHDTDSKVERINAERIAVMLAVARELRALP